MEAMCDVSRGQCKNSGTEKRCSDNGANLNATKPKVIEIGRQDNESDSVNECTNGSCEDENARVASCRCWKKCDVRTVTLTSACRLRGSATPR